MFGGINPGQMKAMMKQLGIKQEDIEVLRVIIEKADGNKVIIEPAQVQRIVMQGQESWQVSGESREESGMSESDIELVAEKTGKSKIDAKKAIEEAGGDIAQAILSLSES